MQKPPGPSGAATPQNSASRAVPPIVPFIVFNSIKYRQVLDATDFGKERRTGYLAVYPEDGDEPLWLLKVYQTTKVEHLKQDIRDVFFKRMELDAENHQLLIELGEYTCLVIKRDFSLATTTLLVVRVSTH